MLIFLEKEFVFFENHKTASTALHSALAPHADMVFQNHPHSRHLTPRRFELGLKPMLQKHYWKGSFETAAVIREPLDWLSSWYRYRKRDEIIDQPQSTANVDFEQFLDAYMQPEQPAYAHLGKQSSFLKNASKTLPETLWRYDAIESFVQHLETRLDLKISLDQQNISDRQELVVSSETKSKLEEFLSEDFKIYEAARKS